MTQRTINLYDGLEALYYFDSDYFDGTTGEIKDKSGHGRHATAQAGATVGVNGPNDFEAANFSGGNSGDTFKSETVIPTTTQTMFAIARADAIGDGTYQGIVGDGDGSSGMWINRDGKGNLQAAIGDGASIGSESVAPEANTWFSVFARYNGGQIQLGINGDVVATTQHQGITKTTNTFSVGNINGSATAYWGGQVAVAGKWSRFISDIEIEALNDLTAPRRSML